MEYQCSICHHKVEGDPLQFIDHTEGHIIEAIKDKHPEWAEEDGLCQKCVEYYKNQIKGDV